MSTTPPSAGVRESRERRRLYLPPLAVPGQRASLLFGIGGGCVPMLVGFGAWALFWFGGDEPPTGLRKWGTLAFSLVLFLMGLRFALETFRPAAWLRPREAEGDAPWKEGFPWRRHMAPYDAGTTPGRIVFAFLGLAVFLPVINFPLLDGGFDWPIGRTLILIFDVFLISTLGAVLHRALGLLRIGAVRLQLETYPAERGGTLRAALVARSPLPLAGPVAVTLHCVEEPAGAAVVRDPGEGGTVEAVYSQERTVAPPAGRVRRLDLELPLPADLPATRVSAEPGPRRYWLLELQLPLRGPDAHLYFLVPVY